MKRNTTEFTVLPSYHGDCIIVKTFDINNNEFIILIDGGTAQTFRYSLKAELKDINHIDLLILTHIDSDHIAGLISLFKSSLIDSIIIDEIWMNHPEIVEINNDNLISTKQGDTLKELILSKKPNIKLLEVSTNETSILRQGIEFIILSPTQQIKDELYNKWQLSSLPKADNDNVNISSQKEVYSSSLLDLNKIEFIPDKSINGDIYNSSSIAFILKCLDMTILLLADARPEVITETLKLNGYSEVQPLQVDYVKVSHHGSLNNTSQEMLGLIKCNDFIISTNGGTADHKFPSRETIARIVYSSQRNDEELNIYFNYKIEDIKERIGDFIDDLDFNEGNWNVITKNWFEKK
ncbi:TPA: MBL fold metallo-hydrolase [Elizabethkingia anophelis]|nr:MBL fold metallo-hydrolase [Elizabethkingia anophelis]HBN6707281.1 MBL fold metallo-hydrolase [Elizabethkingia anophelis]HBN6711315.1 MBL fold metallo-hydrolase [Elizabethkingia anophelis]HBN6714101.1 MBL fold metallo-hydrolase [Elizabethkingia anophelis]HBN6719639.1 MBL fold metallo-hydrolase [Elizabethkingia anophelis]